MSTLIIRIGQRTNVKNASAKEAVKFALLTTTWTEDQFFTTKNSLCQVLLLYHMTHFWC